MPAKITIKKGLKANLSPLSKGELALTTDTSKVYIGNEANYILNPVTEIQATAIKGRPKYKIGFISALSSSVNYSQTFNSNNIKIQFNTKVPLSNTNFTYNTTTSGITIPVTGAYRLKFIGNFKGTTFSYPLALRCAYVAKSTSDFYFYTEKDVSCFQVNIDAILPLNSGVIITPSIVGFQNTTDKLETYSMSEATQEGKLFEVLSYSLEYIGPIPS